MTKTRGICFDMDGVIIDGMKFHAEAWTRTFRHFWGFEIDVKDVYIAEGLKSEYFIQQMAEKYHQVVEPPLRDEMFATKRQYFGEIFTFEPMPGAHQTIELVARMQYVISLVTGTERELAVNAITRLDLLDKFTHIISADDVRLGKPSPEPYLAASKKTGIDPRRCLVIENAPAGIASAKAAGMTCIALETSLGREYLSGADLIFNDHAELQAWLTQEYQFSTGVGAWQAEN